jgi:hypothetical protein
VSPRDSEFHFHVKMSLEPLTHIGKVSKDHIHDTSSVIHFTMTR